MQLEAGKKYTDRRGRVYGPMVQVSDGCHGVFGENRDDYGWYRDGRRSPGRDIQGDLVAEYVEPVKASEPEYRMLQEGELIKAGDQYFAWDGKWETAPDLGRTWKSSIYVPHRRLVKHEETKASEPADTRVTAGEGYRLLNVGEHEQEGDEYYNADKSKWVPTGLIGSRCTNADLINGYSIRRKVEQPAPVESPDDWVILDPVVYAEHVPRVGIDQFQGWKDDEWVTQESFHSKQPIGLWHGANGGNQTRCRRKDLPPVPPQRPVEPEFPQYYVSDEWDQTAYIKRTNKVDSVRVMLDGRVQDAESPWYMHSASLFASGFLRLVTQAEAESRVKNTRTVVLKP